MSSTIFERNQAGVIVPRQDAHVRIFVGKKEIWRNYGRRKQRIGTEDIYELCKLLEFWPDWDYRMKFRGRVLVRPTEKLMEVYTGKPGISYDETWMELRETELHPEDRENLYIHCARKLDGGALIIHRARPELEEVDDQQKPNRYTFNLRDEMIKDMNGPSAIEQAYMRDLEQS